MATRTIECGECGESLPYGRLSCPACGALLAAVTRGRPSTGTSSPAAITRGSATTAASPPAAPVYLIDPAPDVVDEPAPELSWTPWPPLVELEAAGAAPAAHADPPPDPSLEARPYRRGSSTRTDDRPGVTPPGAYLPPSPAASVALTGVGGATSAFGGPGVPDPTPARSATIRTALPSLDAARMGEVAGWLVSAGSAMAALGFLLPWSVAVIGARGYGGYLDDWGLASPTHVLALAAVLVTLGLGVVKTNVPAWLRTGVLGLALGGMLIGLTWPYAIGPLGADIGAMLATLGGLALVAGGALALWSDRHAGPGLPV